MTDTPTAAPQSIGAILAARMVPDARGWCALAIFILTLMILGMIRENPSLLTNASFMQLATTIAGAGGFGLWVAFNFATSSGTAKANERADKANARADAATTITVPPPGEVTVSTEAKP